MVKNPIGITNMSVGFCNFATLTCQQWKISSNKETTVKGKFKPNEEDDKIRTDSLI